MKPLIQTLFALLILPLPCVAQDVRALPRMTESGKPVPLEAQEQDVPLQISRQNEKKLRELCMAQDDADTCTQWTAVASCVMNYRETMPEVARLQSDDELQKYRINAAQNLPKLCSPIARILLQIDILNSDLALKNVQLSPKDRKSRWLNIIQLTSASEIIPQQRQLVASELINAPDFEAIKDLPQIKQFIATACDEAFLLLPEIPTETASFLTQLEIIESTAMTPRSEIVLAMLDLRNGRYLSAKQHLLNIDSAALTEAEIARFAPEIRKNGVHLAKDDDFMNEVCLSEIPHSTQDNRKLRLFQMMMDTESDSAIYVLRGATGLYLKTCEFERLSEQFAAIVSKRYSNPDVQAYFGDLIKYITTHPEPALIRPLFKSLSSLGGNALETIKRRYGTDISKLALNLSRYDIAAKDYDKAQSLLSDALNLVPDDASCALRLQYGRALHLANKRIPARQQWGYIIDHFTHFTDAQCRELAFTLSIQSFLKDGKKADAQSLEKQMLQP